MVVLFFMLAARRRAGGSNLEPSRFARTRHKVNHSAVLAWQRSIRSLPPGTTMPEETIDAGLLEQTKNQIRKLVAEIADLAESDIQPAEFYVEFLNRAVAAVAASGGAFWLMDGRGEPEAPAPAGIPADGPDSTAASKTAPHDASWAA